MHNVYSGDLNTNIWIADFYKSSIQIIFIQMPGCYYLEGKKIVDTLSAIQITF